MARLTIIVLEENRPPWGHFDPVWPKGELIPGPKDTLFRPLEPFYYTDKTGTVWAVPADGWCSDGASIPSFLWWPFGHPFAKKNLPASLVHDWYCSHDHGGMTRGKVNRMFYEALRCSGRGSNAAKAMYTGVMIGAPRW